MKLYIPELNPHHVPVCFMWTTRSHYICDSNVYCYNMGIKLITCFILFIMHMASLNLLLGKDVRCDYVIVRLLWLLNPVHKYIKRKNIITTCQILWFMCYCRAFGALRTIVLSQCESYRSSLSVSTYWIWIIMLQERFYCSTSSGWKDS